MRSSIGDPVIVEFDEELKNTLRIDRMTRENSQCGQISNTTTHALMFPEIVAEFANHD
jgi:hypothetical protein